MSYKKLHTCKDCNYSTTRKFNMSRHSQITHVNQSNQPPTTYIEGSEVESATISVPLHQDRRRGVDQVGSGSQSSTSHMYRL